MNQVITVTFDGQVLKPKEPLNLDLNKEYQIQVIFESNDNLNSESNEQLEELHEEFDWLIADIGVKQPLTREKSYQ